MSYCIPKNVQSQLIFDRSCSETIASYRLSEISCSKDVACCKSWTNLLVSVSNTEYLEQFPKIGKACVLNLMSFGEMTNEEEVSPCCASSSACWLRTSSECPLTLTRITVMLRLCIHVRIRFHIGNMGLLYLWAVLPRVLTELHIFINLKNKVR